MVLVDGRKKKVDALKMMSHISTAERFVWFEDEMWEQLHDGDQEIVIDDKN